MSWTDGVRNANHRQPRTARASSGEKPPVPTSLLSALLWAAILLVSRTPALSCPASPASFRLFLLAGASTLRTVNHAHAQAAGRVWLDTISRNSGYDVR